MSSSGTEATMSALRLARGATGRDKIIKFEGCYHGHSDSLLIKAGSGALTFGVPSSPGVPEVLAQHTNTLPYNDTAALEQAFAEIGDELACVIIEPVTGNMNCILPEPGFLETLRSLCTKHGAVLIFDEVMTGFRFGTQCAQGWLGIHPRPHLLWQSDRRRHASRSLRGPTGHHGTHLSPLGPCLSGGHLVGQSSGNGGGTDLPDHRGSRGFLR